MIFTSGLYIHNYIVIEYSKNNTRIQKGPKTGNYLTFIDTWYTLTQNKYMQRYINSNNFEHKKFSDLISRIKKLSLYNQSEVSHKKL